MGTDYHVIRPSQSVQEIIVTEIQYRKIEGAENLSRYDVVYQDGLLIRKADATDSTKMDAIGIMNLAVAQGVQGDVIIRGRVTYSGWSWTSGLPLFVSATSAGRMTQTPPSTSGNICQRLAIALTQTLIEINPQAGYAIGQ